MAKKRKKKQKLVITLIILLVLIMLSLLGLVYYKETHKIDVELNTDLTLEINSQVTLSSLVKEIKNGKLINGEDYVDTTSLGTKDVVLKINQKEKETEYTFKVQIVDTESPIIDVKTSITTYTGTNIDLLSFAAVTDNSNEELTAEITGEYDLTKEGKYEIVFTAKDSSGNKTESKVNLTVKKDPDNYTFTTSNGFQGEVKDGITYIDGILVANKTYSLPSSYGDGMDATATKYFNKMKKAAANEGLTIWNQSGFRSYSTQKSIYNSYVAEDGQAEADTYSARPGHSEHQTGLAIDLNNITYDFIDTPEGKWVNDNCWKYGFILRYTKDGEKETGYKYEPWHIRYVGKELAEKLYNNGKWITLEKYFGITSKYK